jgi:uncharacterized protein (TIGR04141 family)
MSDIKRVTLYKIKPGHDFDDYLNGDLNTYDAFEDEDGGYAGYIRYVKAGGAEKTEDGIPWLRFLNSGFDVKRYTYAAHNYFPRAIMALRVSTEGGGDAHFAAAFGQHGDAFLDRSRIIHDFGIKVGMNICDIDKLRRVQTSAHEAISRQTERQASIGASLRAFGINTEAEILRTLAGNVKDEYADLIESFKGKDSIQIKLPKDTPFGWSALADVCRRLDERYTSPDYRDTEFRSYDNLRQESDPDIIDALDAALCAKIEAKDFSKVHLAPPEFLEFDDPSFAYRKREDDDDEVPRFDDLRIEDIVDTRRFIKNLTASKLRTWPVFRYDEELERTFPLWNAYQCMVAEMDHGGKTYVLSNGLWREVSQQLKDRVDGYFNTRNLHIDAAYLPVGTNIYHVDRKQNREEVYNEVAARGSADLFLLDQSQIEIAGRRIYEICDLMHADKHFVHVKRYSSGSASIGHLFTQAKMYSHAICSDEPTRVGISQWVQNDGHDANAAKDKARFAALLPAKAADFNDTDYTVVFCILHHTPAFALDDLPFMARYELMLAHSYLTEDRRFRVGVCFRQVELGVPAT